MQDDAGRDDGVAPRLTALADRLATDLAGRATVETAELPGVSGTSWTLRPLDPRSTPVQWLLLADEVLLWVGRLGRGGRFELDRTAEDVGFLERVVRAAVAGRVREVSAPARSRVEVILEDGQVVGETGYAGCLPGLLPLPGWRRWGREVRYAPYRAP
ncbi:hypothetical protein [Geodermatophilus sp. FMUSA9-8]|uniref:hypothetical protein n=1 Tax=Geodermatophilus sp. FMUSA9-8 TaxID=3120155 RepID=UPI003009D6C7